MTSVLDPNLPAPMPIRNSAVDAYKGFLTVLMVSGHFFQILLPRAATGRYLSAVANLWCFPGFLFCLGYACSMAYLSKPVEVARPRILRNAGRLIVAYFVSAIVVTAFVPDPLSELKRILTLRRLAHFSEFLLSFGLLMIVVALLLPWLRRIVTSWWAVVVVGAIGLAATQTIRWVNLPGLYGDILPSRLDNGFPIVCYAAYLVAGMVIARRPVTPWGWIVAALGTASVAVSYLQKGDFERFPPSPYWLAGSALLVLGGYTVANAFFASPSSPLVPIGKRTLPILIISNLILFVLARALGV